MGVFKHLGTMNRLAKQAATLRADYPEAWALGEALADEALDTRSEAHGALDRVPDGQPRHASTPVSEP